MKRGLSVFFADDNRNYHIVSEDDVDTGRDPVRQTGGGADRAELLRFKRAKERAGEGQDHVRFPPR